MQGGCGLFAAVLRTLSKVGLLLFFVINLIMRQDTGPQTHSAKPLTLVPFQESMLYVPCVMPGMQTPSALVSFRAMKTANGRRFGVGIRCPLEVTILKACEAQSLTQMACMDSCRRPALKFRFVVSRLSRFF